MIWNLSAPTGVLAFVKGFRTVAALGLAAILAGCGQVAPPQGATPVHFTVLTKQGALERGIFAATSVDGLRSQETPIGPQPVRTCATADERGCFAAFTTPPGSLLVAMQPMGCADNRLDTAYLKGGVLTFVINWTNTCPPGAGTVAVPQDLVVAVPVGVLPKILLPLELDFSEGGKPIELASKGLVDLRPSGQGHARLGNFSLDAAPLVVKDQSERITLTIFGLRAILQNSPGSIDIAALDQTGRVVWHQAALDDPTIFKCLVGTGQSNTCGVGSYSVEMPTVGVHAGTYVIRLSFVPFTLPSLMVDVVTG
jgi:hypothetical protein